MQRRRVHPHPCPLRWAAVLLGLCVACAAGAPRPVPGEEPPVVPRPPAAPPAVLPLPAPLQPDASLMEGALLRVTLAAVGDVLLQGDVQASARARAREAGGEVEGFVSLFAPIADELRAPDLLFANLESPVAPRDGEVRTGPYSFNAPPAAAAALRRVGVDVVNVAHNHIFDRKRRGLLETLRHLEAQGLVPVGAGPSPRPAGPRLLEVEGMRVAFLAWTQLLNRDFNACAEPDCPQVAVLREWAPAEAEVREAAAQADAVVVSLHWGREYEVRPGRGEVLLARQLCEAGAYVVLGHHPHVLQPLELYRRGDGTVCLIAYSLGNLVSNQVRFYRQGVHPPATGEPRDGVLLRFRLARRRDRRAPAALTGVDVLPLWTENQRGPDGAPSIQVVALARALAGVRRALASPGAQVLEARGALQARERLYLERLRRISERVGPQFVRPPQEPPPDAPVVAR